MGFIVSKMSRMTKKPDFIALLKYRSSEEGGRETHVLSGYRPHIKFAFAEMQTSGRQTFINKEKVYPGDSVEAEIAIISVDFFRNSLEEGTEFEFLEGTHLIGTGKITRILNNDLQKK